MVGTSKTFCAIVQYYRGSIIEQMNRNDCCVLHMSNTNEIFFLDIFVEISMQTSSIYVWKCKISSAYYAFKCRVSVLIWNSTDRHINIG